MSALLLRDGEAIVGAAANLTEVSGRRTAAQKPKLYGMRLTCKVHSDRAESDKRDAAEEAARADAFLRDTTSKWCRAIPLSERGKR